MKPDNHDQEYKTGSWEKSQDLPFSCQKENNRVQRFLEEGTGLALFQLPKGVQYGGKVIWFDFVDGSILDP